MNDVKLKSENEIFGVRKIEKYLTFKLKCFPSMKIYFGNTRVRKWK